jgi:hypothetical protein
VNKKKQRQTLGRRARVPSGTCFVVKVEEFINFITTALDYRWATPEATISLNKK